MIDLGPLDRGKSISQYIRDCKLFIPTFMRGIPTGEGQKSFPYFFHSILPFILVLGICLFPLESTAQKSEKDELSRFDRLAEEATLLNMRGQADQVIALLEPNKRDKKNDSALFFNELGIAYRNKGKLSEAIQAYREAHARDPENPVILVNLGFVYYLKKEYPQAAEQYEKAINLAPRFKEAHANLALAYSQIKKLNEALKEIEFALKLDPNYEQAKKIREEIRKKLQEKK
jgi:tetratricopeptide (TPR) repeat protein